MGSLFFGVQWKLVQGLTTIGSGNWRKGQGGKDTHAEYGCVGLFLLDTELKNNPKQNNVMSVIL